jgi:hypothetical protein
MVMQLRMAALNEPFTGDMHGVRGADYACYRQAKRAGLRSTFRAFLSSRVQNVDSIVRLGDRDLPIVNIKVSNSFLPIQFSFFSFIYKCAMKGRFTFALRYSAS